MVFFALLALGTAVASYVVILLLAAGCISLIFLLPSITSNLQVILMALFGIVVGGALLWSVIPRRDKFMAPGVLLERNLQPRLFAELDQVAGKLGEELPHEVYLISDMNAYVADRGGWLGFKSRRIMALGLPLLSALTVSQFRAVLAHEFAHYYGGDTSLGPWVFKTRMAMIRAFENVGTLGTLARTQFLQVLYALVSAILKWNFKLFLRITNLVSRKQEYRADELACLVAGVESLKGGLERIHVAGAAWRLYWESEVYPLLEEGRIPYIVEGYSKFIAFPEISVQLDQLLKHGLEHEKQSPYDTHPPLRNRLAAVNKIDTGTLQQDERPASCLLDHTEKTELAFVRHELPQLPQQELPHVAWPSIAKEVMVPMWSRMVAEHEAILRGVNVEGVPEAIGNLKTMAAGVNNPKGMLLSPEQRAERAAYLLGAALALTMIERGWELHFAPAELYLRRGEEKVNPFRGIAKLRAGEIAREKWASEYGLHEFGGVALAMAGRKLSSAGNGPPGAGPNN